MQFKGKKCDCTRWKNLCVVLGIFTLCIFTLIAAYTTEWRSASVEWEDNFDHMDESKWAYVVTGNRGDNSEFQYYRREKRNSYTENGVLHIRATLVAEEAERSEVDPCTGYQVFPGCNVQPCLVVGKPDGDCILPVYSAQLHTKDLLDVKRGRIEVRARFPSGDWLIPEIALFPSENAYGGGVASCKITVAHGCGNKDLKSRDGELMGANTVRQGLRWSPSQAATVASSNDSHYKTQWETTLPEGYFSDDFHVFGVEWSQDRIAFLVDGRESGRIIPPRGGLWELGGFSFSIPEFLNPWASGTSMAPFDRPFYIVLRLSAGGKFFDNSMENPSAPRPWTLNGSHAVREFSESWKAYAKTWDRPELEVDYVRVSRL